MNEAEKHMSAFLPECSCDQAYTSRAMTAPDCVKCNYLSEVARGAQEYAAEKLNELLTDLLDSQLHNDFDLMNRRNELNKYGNIVQQYKK